MYFFDDFAEDTASVVVLAEETPVERIEPLLSLRVGDGGKCSDNRIHPATCAEHSKYRLIAVEQQVREKDRGQHRHCGDQQAPCQRILQAPAEYYAQVKHPVPKDRVGERHWPGRVESK